MVLSSLSLSLPLSLSLKCFALFTNFPSSSSSSSLPSSLDNFDVKKALNGTFEANRGIDATLDAASDKYDDAKAALEEFKNEALSSSSLRCSPSAFTYINTDDNKKDKYLIELSVSIKVPSTYTVKGKRGTGSKQVNKYSTPDTERIVAKLEEAIEAKKEGRQRALTLVFAKFDKSRTLWQTASVATAMLDALGALAEVAKMPGMCRPTIEECEGRQPHVEIIQGRHPCLDLTHDGSDFIPNDISLGGNEGEGEGEAARARVLLLSGPNMGGKSTLLRQTCLMAILAQIGCFVPAQSCRLTPFDRIFTRLGACDRILSGQSTFFVELSETAAALRGATNRSIVIMDELGTYDMEEERERKRSNEREYRHDRYSSLFLFAHTSTSLLSPSLVLVLVLASCFLFLFLFFVIFLISFFLLLLLFFLLLLLLVVLLLGRGTSTFDGTAIAHAVVKYLVEKSGCLAMFATHYHSLLEDWKEEKSVSFFLAF
jgi:DNA mismatch repair protein MSH6